MQCSHVEYLVVVQGNDISNGMDCNMVILFSDKSFILLLISLVNPGHWCFRKMSWVYVYCVSEHTPRHPLAYWVLDTALCGLSGCCIEHSGEEL